MTGTLVTPLGATYTFEAKLMAPVGFPVQIHVASNQDLDRRSTAQLVALRLGEVEGLTDINIDEKPGIRQIDLNPDYDKMAMCTAFHLRCRSNFKGRALGSKYLSCEHWMRR